MSSRFYPAVIHTLSVFRCLSPPHNQIDPERRERSFTVQTGITPLPLSRQRPAGCRLPVWYTGPGPVVTVSARYASLLLPACATSNLFTFQRAHLPIDTDTQDSYTLLHALRGCSLSRRVDYSLGWTIRLRTVLHSLYRACNGDAICLYQIGSPGYRCTCSSTVPDGRRMQW